MYIGTNKKETYMPNNDKDDVDELLEMYHDADSDQREEIKLLLHKHITNEVVLFVLAPIMLVAMAIMTVLIIIG